MTRAASTATEHQELAAESVLSGRAYNRVETMRGTYVLRNNLTDKCMDYPVDASNPDGLDVRAWEFTGQGNQMWIISAKEGYEFVIQNDKQRKYLTGSGDPGDATPGKCFGWHQTNQPNQAWFLYTIPGQDGFLIQNAYTMEWVQNEIESGNPNGSHISTTNFTGNANQLFQLIPVSGSRQEVSGDSSKTPVQSKDDRRGSTLDYGSST